MGQRLFPSETVLLENRAERSPATETVAETLGAQSATALARG